MSTDGSLEKVKQLTEVLERDPRVSVVLSSGTTLGHRGPRGPGFARNRAVMQSSGQFLCMLDADDVMLPQRIEKQLCVPVRVFVRACFARDCA